MTETVALHSVEEKPVGTRRALGTEVFKEKRLLRPFSILVVTSLTSAQIKQCLALDLLSSGVAGLPSLF